MWPGLTIPGTGVTTSSYHFFHVIGWFTFYLVGSRLTRSRPDLRYHWLWLAIAFGISDTVGAKTAFSMIRGTSQPGFYGTPLILLVVTLLYFLAARLRAYPFLDAWAIAFSASHVFEKTACFAAGCCFGRPTDSAWGIAIEAARGDKTRYQPLPLLEALFHLATALILYGLYRQGLYRGRLVLVLGLAYGSWRSGIELLRSERVGAFLGGPLSITQVLCLMAMSFSAVYLASGPRAEPRASEAS